jgi:hypothetical protein
MLSYSTPIRYHIYPLLLAIYAAALIAVTINEARNKAYT